MIVVNVRAVKNSVQLQENVVQNYMNIKTQHCISINNVRVSWAIVIFIFNASHELASGMF